jgi:hypothetical protein
MLCPIEVGMPKLLFLKNIFSGRLSRDRSKMVSIPPGINDPPLTRIEIAPSLTAYNHRKALTSDESLRQGLNSNPSGLPVSSVECALADSYLEAQGNSSADIDKLHQILQYPCIILEIGCGSCEIAMQIAIRNRYVGIIATDLYECHAPRHKASGYHRVARAWRKRGLAAQQLPLENLVVLKSEIDLLRLLPDQSVDTVLIINPEPTIGKILLDTLCQDSLHTRIKPGPKQIAILPYCREMGVYACGGFEFEHDEDWSLGLGFMMASGFQFRKAQQVQWGVDLYRTSPYWRNSTQTDVYVCGNGPG